MKCKCGSEHFKAHPKDGVLQCWRCNQRYKAVYLAVNPSDLRFMKWMEQNFSKPQQVVQAVKEAVSAPLEWVQLKVMHPKREKPGIFQTPEDKQQEILAIEKIERTQSLDIENRIKHRWISEIKILETGEKPYFSNYTHKGKMRGKDIARICHRDLQRIGIKTRLVFDDGGGSLEAI